MGQQFDNGEVLLQIRTKLNANAVALDSKVDKVNGKAVLEQLPDVVFSGLTGQGTQEDPFIVTGGLSPTEIKAYFQSLPNFATDRVLQGDFTWVDMVDPSLEKLATPTLTFGIPSVNGVPMSWTAIQNGTTYTVQRDTNSGFVSPFTVYVGSGLNVTDIGLSPATRYYYRIRVTASGFAGSNYYNADIITAGSGNITPGTPTNPITDNVADTFNWTNVPGYGAISNYEYTVDAGITYSQVTVKPVREKLIGPVLSCI